MKTVTVRANLHERDINTMNTLVAFARSGGKLDTDEIKSDILELARSFIRNSTLLMVQTKKREQAAN